MGALCCARQSAAGLATPCHWAESRWADGSASSDPRLIALEPYLRRS
jgi:hypothetical protein